MSATGQSLEPGRSRGRWWRSSRFLAILLGLDIAVLLVMLSFANITSDGPAKRALGQTFAVLVEIDAYLDQHEPAIRQQPNQSFEPVPLPDLPIELSLSADEARNDAPAVLRQLIIERAAQRLHDDGAAALRDGQPASEGRFSLPGVVGSGIDLLRPAPHRALAILTLVFAVAAAALALGLALTTRGYRRLWAVGLSAFLASVPFLALAIGLRFTLRIAAHGTDGYLAREFLGLTQELTWAAIRDGTIFVVGSGAIALAGLGLGRWSDLRPSASR